MVKRASNLKKRLDEIREQPSPPVEVSLDLDAELYQTLKALARQHRQPLEAYLLRVLSQHADDTTEQS